MNKREKYLLINATDINKQLYQFERVAYCNDFFNIYHRVKKIDAKKIFEKNNVPDEYQKIIIKISAPVFKRNKAKEFMMGFPFDFSMKTREKIDNKKYIRMNNIPIYYDGNIFDDKIVFKTEEQYTSFNNVMYFLEEIYKKGCLENYLQSIKEFLDISLDFGLVFDLWHESHNKRKVVKKLYESYVPSISSTYADDNGALQHTDNSKQLVKKPSNNKK